MLVNSTHSRHAIPLLGMITGMNAMVYPKTPVDTGIEIKAIQTVLVYVWGVSCPINSKYDLATRNAVKSFQSRHGLTQTGNVYADTFYEITRG